MLFLPFIGVLTGLISGFFGIGGGTVLVPILLALGYDIKTAIGISVMQMFIAALFGSYFNYKRQKFELKTALSLGFGALIGGSFSGVIVSNVPEIYLKLLLIFTIFLALLRLIFSQTNKQNSQKELHLALLFILGAVIGAVAISIGMGGSVFLMPILVGFLGVDIKKAVSLGLFFVIFSSFGGLLSLGFGGFIDYEAGLLLSFGALFGVYLGTLAHHKIDKTTQKWCLVALNISMLALLVYNLIAYK